MPGSVEGLNELSRKLAKLGPSLAGRELRKSAMYATTTVVKEMKQAAPRGKEPHRTYKGRLVSPGFLSRSVKRKSSYRNGKATVTIGVKKEAFYGVMFVEKGTKPHVIPKKRSNGAWRRNGLSFGGRVVKSVNHPGASPKPWFKKTFVSGKMKMLDRFKDRLIYNIKKAAR